ncbi:DUF3077 domain-containing protein [Pseudomonas sp. FSL R10-0056]|uniref:DUF3077 domain-containing protein n=1 Tax=Pseudomonas TaxID=286 RepID=UPI000BA2725A|nr:MULTISPECIES: DUF3077 domain-containing protein [Pseudomonas]MDN5405655.1 DUF3077 domain-containing protein [Pseudomonas sp.]MDN5448794.1 DUF3077 domain-containing protein [Pseudomonas sp.]MDN5451815.1 DUF3077 domain-containing protein [Pseudomonas sp.]MDN5459481.1 DUF3077 domain-containing protein [Pseudomonas sp.]MDN5497313.1 DUF3077 domain-containing protein [Pseudomonas sp.]
MADHPPIKTLGTVTFDPCGQDNHELFRVNPDIPLRQALEQVSALLYCAKKLALDAALDKNCERHAWASHYLCDMGKAVIDDVCLREF